jgi:nicotinate phosphoribosyltransferase
VRAAIDVVRELDLRDRVAVRLDSGDLAALAHQARQLLDAAGLAHVEIVASGGLDEHKIAALVAARAPIDVYGVGTKVGVSADAPSLDSASTPPRRGAGSRRCSTGRRATRGAATSMPAGTS